MATERETWIDAWKGFLILLVVVGHVVGMLYHFSSGGARQDMGFAYKFIYLFHMPAFFFLAGYAQAGRAASARPFPAYVRSRAQRLLVPYLAWGLLSVLVFLALVGPGAQGLRGAPDGYYSARMWSYAWWRPFLSLAHAGGWPGGDGFRCNSVLWFLPCLFVVQVAWRGLTGLPLVARAVRTWCGLAVVCVCLFALAWFVRRYGSGHWPWGADRAPWFLAFLVAGELAGRVWRRARDKDGRKAALVTGVVQGWIAYGWLAYGYPDLYAGHAHVGWFVAEAGMALAGCVLSLMTARLCGRVPSWAALGVSSMGVMLCHKFFILPFQFGLGRATRVVPVGILTGVCLAVGLTALVVWGAMGVTRAVRRRLPFLLGERKML